MDPATLLTGGLNTLLGLVYVSYGVLTLVELRRHQPTRGTSHLGWAWVWMAFTCGPHHFDHGLHLLRGGSPAGLADLGVVLVGLPAAVVWFLLRVEALRGGSGDRRFRAELGVEALRTLLAAALVVTVVVIGTLPGAVDGVVAGVLDWRILPNVLLVVLYTVLGLLLVRGQVRRYARERTWSTSGLAMATIFPTCAAMHAVFVAYVAGGHYQPDTHLLVVDALAVPSALYFLTVTWLIGEGRLGDWSEPARDLTAGTPTTVDLAAR